MVLPQGKIFQRFYPVLIWSLAWLLAYLFFMKFACRCHQIYSYLNSELHNHRNALAEVKMRMGD